jgi:hypothetical protein
MVTGYTLSQKERLEYNGYRFIHLFRNVYLVRNYSTRAREVSLYGIAVLKRGE